jgi:hypothetical protein
VQKQVVVSPRSHRRWQLELGSKHRYVLLCSAPVAASRFACVGPRDGGCRVRRVRGAIREGHSGLDVVDHPEARREVLNGWHNAVTVDVPGGDAPSNVHTPPPIE